ncbi:MAG TPA: DUF3617 family protein [Candidatus Acidoferrales bacterium]|nr:DUF3617 family protein [Candidatus Acidoferrales bacterium]
MRRALSLAVIALVATVVFAATEKLQPLKVKTGLWQMTETLTWKGLPPQMAAMMNSAHPTRTYKSCVTAKDLNTNPWAEGSGDNCTWTVLNSNGTDMEVRGTSCDLGKNYDMTAELHGTVHVVDSEHGTGSMAVTVTGNGQTMNGHASYTGKWVGATCPAEMNDQHEQ